MSATATEAHTHTECVMIRRTTAPRSHTRIAYLSYGEDRLASNSRHPQLTKVHQAQHTQWKPPHAT